MLMRAVHVTRPIAQHLMLVSLLLLFPAEALNYELGGPGSRLASSLVSLAIVLCLLRIVRTRTERVIAVVLTLLTVVPPLIGSGKLWSNSLQEHIVGLAVTAFVFKVLLGQVWNRTGFDAGMVSATLSLYMILGSGWAHLYGVVLLHDPAAFNAAALIERRDLKFQEEAPTAASDAAGREPNRRDELTSGLLYFSFVTLSTLGYGDVTPDSPLAMALATLEAIVGQLFLVVIVARAVALSVATSAGQGARPPPEA